MNNNFESLKLTTNINSYLSRVSKKPTANEPLNDERKKEIKEVCEDLEGLFLGELLKTMRQTVPESGLLGKGMGQEIYREMLDKELVKRMSHSGGFGLAQVLYQQLTDD